MKYKHIENKVIDLSNLYERQERMKYKLKLYSLNILNQVEIDKLKERKSKMSQLERDLGNMLYDINETSKKCVELIDWYENDREALILELTRLRELNKELLNDKQ